MCIREENTIAVSLEVFNFWTHSVLDHHIISSSGISETWCRRYKQLMYLWNTDVPSNDLNTWSLTKACISLTRYTELQKRAPFREISIPSASGSLAETRLAHRLCHLDFPLSPRQQDNEELWSWREERAKHISPVCTLSCWGSTLEEWTEQKIPARNDLLSYKHNNKQKCITFSSRAVFYIFEDMFLHSIC